MILVTGGTGLVGSHLLFELTSKNNKVKAIYRSKESLKSVKKVFSYFSENAEALFSKIEWILADITDVTSLEAPFKNATVVYHVAALVSFDERNYRKMRQVNIEGTANVVNFCIANKVRKMCFVSSIATIGEPISNKVVTEENEWTIESDNTGYAITKHGAEMEVWRASQEGVEVIIVNPGVILGAGFWEINTGQFFSKVDKGLKFYTTGITGFVGVKDVVKSMILLTDSNHKNERFIVVSENKKFKDVFTIIANNLGKKPPSIKASKIVISILRRVDGIITFLTRKTRVLNKNTEKSLFNESYYSSEKVKKTISFEFTKIDKVIEQICAFYIKG